MRRTPLLVTIGLLSLSACGSDSDATVDSQPLAEETASPDEPEDTTAETADDDGAPASSDDAATSADSDKPDVSLPDEAPTELIRTVLIDGEGDGAVAGDTLVVDYVGVRSVDGEEFDSSYERAPFPITLGAGRVIQGWEDGLVGAQAGERVQLDIPSALAYGEAARGDIIGENEDLTFVIDVRSIVAATNPEDAPTEPGVDPSEGAVETTFEDLVVGDGDTLESGTTALVHYVNFRGDNGVAIESTWAGDPQPIPYGQGLLPGLLVGMEGMNVGGRRAITIPPEDGFGPDGNPQAGLPAGTDMIFVVDLLAVY